MATPYLHPKSGVFYVRRQLPADVREAFGYTLHQVSLGTKDPAEAKHLFARASLELDDRIAAVRATASAQRDANTFDADRAAEFVKGYLDEYIGASTRGATLLGTVHADAFMIGMLTSSEDDGNVLDRPESMRVLFETAPADVWQPLLATHVEGLLTHRDLGTLPDESVEMLTAAFGKLLPRYELAGTLSRNERAAALGHNRRHKKDGQLRMRPDMRLGELYEAWKKKRKPSPQTAHEYALYAGEFTALIGDVAVEEVTRDDLFDYRDEAASLVRKMSKADRLLPFHEQVAKFALLDAPKISPGSIKKRVGAIQALLKFGFGEMWITNHVGALIPIEGYSKKGVSRRDYREDEVATLFACPLFLQPGGWNQLGKVADVTLYWLFLLGITVGARIEEMGQALLADCGIDGGVHYIDVTDYVDERQEETIDAKSVKTVNSRRLIPIHDTLIACGFDKYLTALRAAGATELFPELVANQFGKRTKEASRSAGRIIDKYAADDPRLVFHSLRHLFKSLGRDSDVSKAILDQICGHASVDVGDRYGRGARLQTLKRNLMKIDFSIVPWDGILAASATIDWPAAVATQMLPRTVRGKAVPKKR